MKRKSHPELFILLAMGVKPKTLIDKGYSEATVYKYNRQMPEIKEKINQLHM